MKTTAITVTLLSIKLILKARLLHLNLGKAYYFMTLIVEALKINPQGGQ